MQLSNYSYWEDCEIMSILSFISQTSYNYFNLYPSLMLLFCCYIDTISKKYTGIQGNTFTRIMFVIKNKISVECNLSIKESLNSVPLNAGRLKKSQAVSSFYINLNVTPYSVQWNFPITAFHIHVTSSPLIWADLKIPF